MDKVKDLLVVSETNQIVFQMMQAKQAVQQSNDNQNSTGVFGKGNVVADMSGWVLIVKQMFFIRILKIRGAIGEAGQKDKLTYVSLLKQVEEGKDKGFSDKKIVNAIIKATTRRLYLRNVLETTDNLTSDRLIKFLQSHFGERNTLDLSQQLTSLTHNQFHNILILFDVLPNFSSTTSETM